MSSYVDRTAGAVEYCESAAQAHPENAELYSKIGGFLSDKLWHQLTVTVLEFLEEKSRGPHFAELYDKVVLAVDSKLHPLSTARMAVLVASELASQNDVAAAKAVVENCMEKQADHLEATIFLQSKHAMLTLQQLLSVPGFSEATADAETKETLAKILETIQSNAPIIKELSSSETKADTDASRVHASHYEAAMTYYKLVGPPEAFYEQAMQYLNYGQGDAQLATDLCLAALTGDGVYNLTAVEQTPVVQLLRGTASQWLVDLLQATAAGDVPRFRQLSRQHAALIATQPALTNRAAAVQEKLTLTALVLTVLAKDSHERNLSFAELQAALHLDSLDQVEWVLMRAFSVGLLSGSMDQCEQTVDITWVQPRVLSAGQMSELAVKFGEWAVKVHKTKESMQERTASTLLA